MKEAEDRPLGFNSIVWKEVSCTAGSTAAVASTILRCKRA
jgi:hypothetical protein